MVINPQKVTDITDRKNIAACVDYNSYSDLLKAGKKKAVFLNSLIPPVYGLNINCSIFSFVIF